MLNVFVWVHAGTMLHFWWSDVITGFQRMGNKLRNGVQGKDINKHNLYPRPYRMASKVLDEVESKYLSAQHSSYLEHYRDAQDRLLWRGNT